MVSRVMKILGRIEIVLVIIALFFSLFIIIFEKVLPARGLHVLYNNEGQSMEPTLREGGLVISDDTPYEELQVGDIIEFRNIFRDINMSVTTFKKNPETGKLEAVSVNEQNIPGARDNVIHRIITIDEEGLHTRGDNNPANDPKPIPRDAYISKITWHMNYIGWPFKIMYAHGGFYGNIIVIIIVGVSILITWKIANVNKPDDRNSAELTESEADPRGKEDQE